MYYNGIGGIMIIPLLVVGLFIGLNVSQQPPALTTPRDIAEWSKCDTAKIAYWIGQKIDYKTTKGWESAEACIARGNGDCKCMAVVAKAVLDNCIGYEARIATLKARRGPLHAVTLYTDHKGQRGYINATQGKRFDRGTNWAYVVEGISGGPWVEQ